MKANIETMIQLYGTASGGQTDTSSFIGRKYRTQDTKYGHSLNEFNTPDEAEKSALARPYTKVVSQPDLAMTPKVRDMARRRLVKTNPDVDGAAKKRKKRVQ